MDLEPWKATHPHWQRTSVLVAVVFGILTFVVALPVFGGNEDREAAAGASADVPRDRSAPPDDPVADPDFDNSRGWGPARPTFTVASPPPYAVFNSITDNPMHGDERNFLQCRNLTEDGPWVDEAVAKDQHVFECAIFFANDVPSNLDEVSTGRLHGAKTHVAFPGESLYNPGMTASLLADNASTVWDSFNWVSARPMRVIYVYGSTRMITRATGPEGLAAPEEREGGTIVAGLPTADGVPLGYGSFDGELGASDRHSGHVIFEARIELD